VEIRRNSRAGQLIVDNGVEVVNGTSPGNFNSLNTNSGYLFVGGVPAIMTSNGLLQQVIPFATFAARFYGITLVLVLKIQLPVLVE
jgi:hypothetical protein